MTMCTHRNLTVKRVQGLARGMTWGLCVPGRNMLLAVLALSALLLGLLNCSVVESASTTSHREEQGTSPTAPDDRPNCCALLVYLPHGSTREPFADASNCQINGDSVLAHRQTGLGRGAADPIGAARDRASPSHDQDITCVPCGLRAPPGVAALQKNPSRWSDVAL